MSQETLPLAAVILAASLLGACGQKGPLYLPQDPASPAPVPAQSPMVVPAAAGTVPGGQAETTEEKQKETRRAGDSAAAAEELEPAVEK
ncbi:LPS translocon maturation chaperone LptM [Microbulbifer guangxiensis]|uniref:LPS translocon maturation chaperone LptM n=1 Tax=Microbulbifer guangxiensis TaxID=2904249 RepID=UPI001F26A693|nr:lipoprotein [Microbulbifer guangxiensis]